MRVCAINSSCLSNLLKLQVAERICQQRDRDHAHNCHPLMEQRAWRVPSVQGESETLLTQLVNSLRDASSISNKLCQPERLQSWCSANLAMLMAKLLLVLARTKFSTANLRFFLVQEGTANLSKDGSNVILEKNDFFGEKAESPKHTFLVCVRLGVWRCTITYSEECAGFDWGAPHDLLKCKLKVSKIKGLW